MNHKGLIQIAGARVQKKSTHLLSCHLDLDQGHAGVSAVQQDILLHAMGEYSKAMVTLLQADGSLKWS